MMQMVKVLVVLLVLTQVSYARGPRRWFSGHGGGRAYLSESERNVDTSEVREIEQQIVDSVNVERARYGFRPLVLVEGLLYSMRDHVAWMARNRRMVHTADPVAENIAEGQQSVAEVMNSWLNSPGHRANLLNPNYTSIGVGVYVSEDNIPYWGQRFE